MLGCVVSIVSTVIVTGAQVVFYPFPGPGCVVQEDPLVVPYLPYLSAPRHHQPGQATPGLLWLLFWATPIE